MTESKTLYNIKVGGHTQFGVAHAEEGSLRILEGGVLELRSAKSPAYVELFSPGHWTKASYTEEAPISED